MWIIRARRHLGDVLMRTCLLTVWSSLPLPGHLRRNVSLIALLFLLAHIPLTAWADHSRVQQLQHHYQQLRESAKGGPFGVPLSIHSEEASDQVSAEVYGIIEHPFETVGEALRSPASWCEFAPLHMNVKACTFQIRSYGTSLTLYVGRKYYQEPQAASPQSYLFSVQVDEPNFLSVVLSAEQGIFGTTAHRLQLEATGVDGKTVVALRSSYVPSVLTRLATSIYLVTAGRNKVGFSLEDGATDGRPRRVKGFRGLIERNVMRYYLAFEAFLDFQSIPLPYRLEACLNAVYDMLEQYPTQLHELEKAEFLDTKRREHENQLRLQRQLDTASTRSTSSAQNPWSMPDS